MSRLVSTLSFLLASIGSAFALTLLSDTVGAHPGLQRLNTATQITDRLEQLRARSPHPGEKRVFLVGDSTLGANESPGSLTATLRRELGLVSSRLSLHAFSGPGLGPRATYFLADELIAAQPELVVLEFSFTHLSDHWNRASMEEFTGWLQLASPPEELSEALDTAHVTLDELLLYQGLVGSELIEPWRELKNEQSRVSKLLPLAADWAEERLSSAANRAFRRAAATDHRAATRLPGKPDRLNLAGARELFGPALAPLDATHPSLALFAATLGRFHERDIPVVVYLNPINVENLQAAGAVAPEVLEANAQVVRKLVEQQGASFLDLHTLLSDGDFDDAAGHFERGRKVRATELLADELCAGIKRSLKRRLALN